jgi:hypothetical protein
MAARPVVGCDIEVYKNYFLVGFRRFSDGKTLKFEKSDRVEFDAESVEGILRECTIVTFNGMAFDVPLIMLALKGATNAQLKVACDQIIKGRVRWWEVEDAIGVTVPRYVDQIDLIEPQPNAFASLKTLAGRLHVKRLQDLPIEPDAVLTHEEMDQTADYCLNSDLPATQALWEAMAEPLAMRVALGADLGEDLRSKSDTRVGMAIIKKRVEERTGSRVKKGEARPGATFRYKAPDYIKFDNPQLRDLLAAVEAHDFIVGPDGKAVLPKFLSDAKIVLGSSTYQMGLGGLHSTESNRAVHSDDDFILIDADVASYYPAIIMTLGLFPPAIGEVFLPVYGGIKIDRLTAKKLKDKARDKGLKISLNGLFGDTSNPYSIAYSPKMTIAITLTGQWALLMAIARLVEAGIDCVSGNTDGVLIKCPRDKFEGFIQRDGKDTERLAPSALAEITDKWERDTGFDLEFVEYRSIYNQSVNSYFAIKADGEVKQKGPFANPWGPKGDMRERLMKNPNMTICTDAVLAYLTEGTPLEQTIRASTDIRSFVTVIKETKGATWRGKYLGKVVRFIWSTDGAPILGVVPHATTGRHKRTPRSDGCRPVMDLPDTFPTDIDYAAYVAEAQKILIEFGARERPPVIKKRRGKVTASELCMWAAAA